jgi:hypothetical protein
MAETLGSLCDKLTIVKLKQYHTEDFERLENLNHQLLSLVSEMDDFIERAIDGVIPSNKLIFQANKVFKREGNETRDFNGTLGSLVSDLAEINCLLWHEQEKVYEFDKVPVEEKNNVVSKLAVLNLERNKCIDKIDKLFSQLILSNSES